MPIERRDMKPENAPRTRTDDERAADDAALLASGEELRTLAELGAELGVGSGSLKSILWPAKAVRYLSSSSPTLYAAKDVREAAGPHLEALRARHVGIFAAPKSKKR